MAGKKIRGTLEIATYGKKQCNVCVFFSTIFIFVICEHEQAGKFCFGTCFVLVLFYVSFLP